MHRVSVIGAVARRVTAMLQCLQQRDFESRLVDKDSAHYHVSYSRWARHLPGAYYDYEVVCGLVKKDSSEGEYLPDEDITFSDGCMI